MCVEIMCDRVLMARYFACRFPIWMLDLFKSNLTIIKVWIQQVSILKLVLVEMEVLKINLFVSTNS